MQVTYLASIGGITTIVADGVIPRDTISGAVRAIPSLVTYLCTFLRPTVVMSLRVVAGYTMH